MFDNRFWGKVEKKTKVDKNTIVSLAKKLQENSFTDKDTLNEVIDTLSNMTGKKVSDEKRKKIIDKICDGKVPNNVDKMF